MFVGVLHISHTTCCIPHVAYHMSDKMRGQDMFVGVHDQSMRRVHDQSMRCARPINIDSKQHLSDEIPNNTCLYPNTSWTLRFTLASFAFIFLFSFFGTVAGGIAFTYTHAQAPPLHKHTHAHTHVHTEVYEYGIEG